MNELALFAGAGGGILGGKLLGWRTVCAVEWDAYARDVLVARQNDGCLEPFPIWDDVQTFDGHPWRGCVDVVSGGFPCQDISAAGKGAGITGARSSMWSHMARIIGEVRPRFVFVENSPVLTSRGLGTVLGDLAAMGYDAQWGVLGAIDAGAPHKRERIWIVADSGENGRVCSRVVPDKHSKEGARGNETIWSSHRKRIEIFSQNREIPEQWLSEPSADGMANGVANQVDRLATTGNGQVPAVAALAWQMLAGQDCQ
jgi:DNA (cytosine-5)-methyltransferase 1